MRKPIPSHSLQSKELFPPAKNHKFLENAHDHPFVPLPGQSTGHHALNAWWLAELSLLAYNETSFVKSKLNSVGLGLVVKPLLNGPSTQGFIVEGAGFTIVAFRGTEFFLLGRDPLEALLEAVEDAVTDAKVALVKAPTPARGRVHRGFSHALDQVFGQLSGLSNSDRALWLTGHSLGGALAILAAARLPKVQGVYTFGSPNVGDADFVAGFPTRSFRFVHGSDFVPKILSAPIFGSYQTEGTIVAFDRGGRLLQESPSRGTGLLAAGRDVLDFISGVPKFEFLDHSPLFYALHLWNLFDAQA
jgi:triacylglycerol lipase